MKTKLTIAISVLTTLCFGQGVSDEGQRQARQAIDRWEDFFIVEMVKAKTNNYAVGLAMDNWSFTANTRTMQLRYFERKAHRDYWAITNDIGCSNLFYEVEQWTTKPLPTSP